MEERICEEREQRAMDFKCQHTLSGMEKPNSLSLHSSEFVGSQALDSKIASLTPEKSKEFVRSRHEGGTAELPDKYKVIAEFFNRMTCSLRLLALRKKLPIFETISRQVETLTGRKFSYRHLSQIKYVLPEAVHTDQILIHDQKTLRMKPDIKVTLLFDVIEDHQSQSPFIALQQLFNSRLLDMATIQPEACEIPEAEMPEPFNRGRDNIVISGSPVDMSSETQNLPPQTELLLNSTHLYPSFNRHFSQHIVEETEKKNQPSASQIPSSCSKFDCLTDQDMGSGQLEASPDVYSRSTTISSPIQLTYPSSYATSTACESTPLKVELEAHDLMLQTPAQLTPKRSIPSCDNKLKTMASQNGTPNSAKRSLDFYVTEGEKGQPSARGSDIAGSGHTLNSTSDEVGCMKCVDHKVDQILATKGLLVEDNCAKSAALLGKGEKNECTGKDHNTNQTGLTQQQMPSCLSNLIALIHRTFQSINSSSITKDELIYKIIINNCDIVERKEVEEQLELLEKLVPDWIWSKLAPSGDVLYNIKKQLDLNSVCRRSAGPSKEMIH